MGSIAERYSLGPHCYQAACQHPCCWEAERMLAKGISPKEVKLSSRECALIDDECPTLTVVDVSQWTKGKEKSNPLYVSNSTDTLVCAASHQVQFTRSLTPLKERKRKSERTLQLPPLTCLDSSNQSKTQVKLNTAWIEPLSSCPTHTSNMLVMWVPNPDHAPVAHTQNSELRAKSPHVAVKEIFCLPPSETLIKYNIRKKTSGVKKRVRFQLSFSQTISPVMDSMSSEQFSVLGHTDGSRQAESRPPPLSDGQAAIAKQRPGSAPFRTKNEDPFVLRNKPLVFHDIKEKRQRKVPGDIQIIYRLDYKNGEESINWENLRAQPYLWKKYNLYNQEKDKDRTIPPEGATAPLSPQHTKHLSLSTIPQAPVPHQRTPILKDSAGKTSPQPQSSLLVGQGNSILKQSCKHSSPSDVKHPFHCLDKDEDEEPMQPGSVVPSAPQPLKPEECPGDKTNSPAAHSPASKKRLQWADLESVESGAEVSGLEPTAPPPSREAQQTKSPLSNKQ